MLRNCCVHGQPVWLQIEALCDIVLVRMLFYTCLSVSLRSYTSFTFAAVLVHPGVLDHRHRVLPPRRRIARAVGLAEILHTGTGRRQTTDAAACPPWNKVQAVGACRVLHRSSGQVSDHQSCWKPTQQQVQAMASKL